MVKEWAKKAVLIVSSLGFTAAHFASAQGTVIKLTNPISSTTLTDVLTKITGFLISIAIPLTAIMALIGGFQMITAAGDPEKFSNGRKTLMYAAIGFAVVVISSGVVSIIKDLLGG